jgi:glycosyltransferase involved in cell wall biosynthesis
MARDNLDIAHFLCNTAPVRFSTRYVLSLHDTIQVTTPQAFPASNRAAAFRRWAMTSYSKWTILRAVRSAARIITVSQHEKAEIADVLRIAADRISVTYLAAAAEYYPFSESRSGTEYADERKRLVLPGRFVLGIGYEPRKNIPLLMEAFARVAPGHPDLHLVIVAAQDERQRFFAQMASEMNLAGRVKILPALHPRDLCLAYNLAELFVFPSDRESFGAPPLEALACGTPTIAMNSSSLPEVLDHAAVLVDGKDVQTWACAIERVLADKDLRLDLVNRGLQQAAKLTWERCAEGTLEVYAQVMAESQVH